MTAYYNEIDPYAAQWLRNLIAAGHIAPGDVDDRSIVDIRPSDLHGYTQCHFFAGIGVWSYALRNAGWPDSRPVWTGSCPCQPFSAAGKAGGFEDERHLWPAWFRLIEECKPDAVLGEQVASKDGLGWLDLVQTDMEKEDYACGAVDSCSAGVGAPHIRQRLRFVALRLGDSISEGLEGHGRHGDSGNESGRINADSGGSIAAAGCDGRLADSDSWKCVRISDGEKCELDWPPSGWQQSDSKPPAGGEFCGLADSAGRSICAEWEQCGGELGLQPQDGSDVRPRDKRSRAGAIWLGHAGSEPTRWDAGASAEAQGSTPVRTECDAHIASGSTRDVADTGGPGPTNGFWRDPDWLFCRDGKWRPVRSGSQPLAHGAPSRVGRLRAYGNAVDAEATRVFIEAVMDCLDQTQGQPQCATS